MIKIATVCTGIGSPEMAIRNLGIPHEIVFGCEIDKYARQTYLANFNPGLMVPDMTKDDWIGEQYYSDLFIGGIPCQAFSLAGKRLGELDPRGLLFFDFYRYVKNQKPKYFIIENVKGLLSDNAGATFQNWINLLGQSVNGDPFMFPHEDSLMYNLHWQVLNTKDYGLPQNRERVFLIGIRNDLPNSFVFPKGVPLKLRLKDILEPEVDEKYYLSDTMLKGLKVSDEIKNDNLISIIGHSGTGGQKGDIYDISGISGCLSATDYKQPKQIKVVAEEINNKESLTLYGNSQDQKLSPLNGCSQTLSAGHFNQPKILVSNEVRTQEAKIQRRATGTNDFRGKEIVFKEQNYMNCLQTGLTNDHLMKVQYTGIAVHPLSKKIEFDGFKDGNSPALLATDYKAPKCVQYSDYRIRKLTPKECFRLQGFPDEFLQNALDAGVSNSQLYKQAGNSISVPVIQAILKNLLKK